METPLVERAFQLAPECETVEQIRASLRREGYGVLTIDAYLHGSLRADLSKRLKGKDR